MRLNKREMSRSKGFSSIRVISCRAATIALCLAGVGLGGCSSTVVDKLEAARRGDPEEMRQAITEIGRTLYAMEQDGVPYDEGAWSAVEYLKEIAAGKVNSLNRAQALSALGRLKRADVGQLFVRSLTDPFWLVRFEAARAIYQNPAEDAKPLIDQLKKERFVEVRVELARAVIAIGSTESLKALLLVLLDQTGRYGALKLKVYDGVVKLSGKSFALEDRESWKQYYVERFPPTKSIETDSPPSPAASPDGARALDSAPLK